MIISINLIIYSRAAKNERKKQKMEYRISDKLKSLKPSAIREILKATSDPGVIPLAAGNPSAEAFPVEEVKKITKEILDEDPILALQYGVTEGYTPLRELISSYMKEKYNPIGFLSNFSLNIES